MFLLVLLVLAVVISVTFANMTLYVIGGLIGLLIVLFTFVIRRRKQK